MKNHWLVNKIVPKGEPFWTFEIYDEKKNSIVAETCVELDELPEINVIESLEVVENGEQVWKPVCMVWEKVNMTYTDRHFLDSKSHIRLLEIDGNFAGILRMYDKHGEHSESWVMHGLKMDDLVTDGKSLQAAFTFHHAMYIYDDSENGRE